MDIETTDLVMAWTVVRHVQLYFHVLSPSSEQNWTQRMAPNRVLGRVVGNRVPPQHRVEASASRL